MGGRHAAPRVKLEFTLERVSPSKSHKGAYFDVNPVSVGVSEV